MRPETVPLPDAGAPRITVRNTEADAGTIWVMFSYDKQTYVENRDGELKITSSTPHSILGVQKTTQIMLSFIILT